MTSNSNLTLGTQVRGIRQTLPPQYMLGRVSVGNGPAELVPFSAVGQRLVPHLNPLIGPPAIKTSGVGIANTNGVLSVEWNAGSVTAIGAGMSLAAGTLTATGVEEWTAGSVTNIGAGLSLTAGTLLSTATGEWNAGTVTSVTGGIAITSGVLGVNWNLPYVNSIGGGINISAGALTVNWNLSNVNVLGAGLSISGGTLSATGSSEWSAGSVVAIGTGLSINSGTLTSTVVDEWSAGSVIALGGDNLYLVSSTLYSWQWMPLVTGDPTTPSIMWDDAGNLIRVQV